MMIDQIISTEAGLIPSNLYKTPTRNFLPSGLHQTSCEGMHLTQVGALTDSVLGCSIGLSLESSIKATLGEFCERYCAAHLNSRAFKSATYLELVESGEPALHPKKLKLYAEWQYLNENFPYKQLTPIDKISWIKGFDLINNYALWIPAFLVYLPYNPSYDGNVKFVLNTSTGLAAHLEISQAVTSGFFECAERQAFCNFWYNQNTVTVPTYSQELILQAFGQNEMLVRFFKNPRVQMKVFDLSVLLNIETMVVFMFFKYKNQLLMTMGASTRFNKEEAILKAAMEAYQGIEYAIMLHNRNKNSKAPVADNFNHIDNFHKHFSFYNDYPHLRESIPILIEAQKKQSNVDTVFYRKTGMARTIHDTKLLGLEELIYVDITTSDVREINYTVARVITPGWAYITGQHEHPFLGADVFQNKDDLFIRYPHPFP